MLRNLEINSIKLAYPELLTRTNDARVTSRVRLAASAWPPTDRARMPVHRCDRRSLTAPAPTSAPSTPSSHAARPQAEWTDPRRPCRCPANRVAAVLRPCMPPCRAAYRERVDD
jgi:hypothetical protein